MKKYKIGIWGQFGDGGKIADGQAVRTTIITNELKKRYGAEKILICNTNNWKRHPFSFFIKTFLLSFRSRKTIIFPADNGFKTVVPILKFANVFAKSELHYVVIGGFLPKLLEEKNKYISALKKYKCLYVQTPNLKKDLEKFGLENIHILSNLKNIPTVDFKDITVNQEKTVKLCTLSRINEEKGIEYAIKAVQLANEKLGEEFISLSVFGMIAPQYADRFADLLEATTSMISYGGVLEYDHTVDTLKEYFAMLFPTFYYGEGFPGNVIDAYNSGLPIIATDWLYNKDCIKDGYNGILVPIKDENAICDAIMKLYNDREFARQIAQNNQQEASKYQPDKVLQEFYSYMDAE